MNQLGVQNLPAIFECSEGLDSRTVDGSDEFNRNQSLVMKINYLSSNEASTYQTTEADKKLSKYTVYD